MTELRFKHVDESNWLERDPTLQIFARMNSSGELVPTSGEDLLRDILTPRLRPAVPEQVCALLEVARGAMVYGYFFYPLYTLASDQLFRVADAAVCERCRQLGGPKRLGFQSRLKWLRDQGVLSDEEFDHWDFVRFMRNCASHPREQAIWMPGDTVGFLARVVDLMNGLFVTAGMATSAASGPSDNAT